MKSLFEDVKCRRLNKKEKGKISPLVDNKLTRMALGHADS
jgi:hypothetical protein